MMDEEVPLKGGKVNIDIVRIGDTVHRVPGQNSEYVHVLLRYLNSVGFSPAPTFLGIDEKGREILSYIEGKIYPGSGYKLNDSQICNAASLIRNYHDISKSSGLSQGAEIVAHGDLGPHNTIYDGDNPIGLIDWDAAAPGTRLRDFAYAVDCYVDLLSIKISAQEQARRVQIMCHAYGWGDVGMLLEDIRIDYLRALENHQRSGNKVAVEIFTDYVKKISARTEEIQTFY